MKVTNPLPWLASGLFLIAFLVFGRSLGFGFVPYDDPAYILGNGYVNQGLSLDGIRWALWYGDGERSLDYQGVTNLWHPLTWFSHMFDISLFGVEQPWGHHFVNVSLHGIAAILMMWVAYRIAGSAPAAFIVTLLWMIHPLKVESVAWISERKDVLSGVFFWASIACVLPSSTPVNSRRKLAGWIFFILALLSKPSVVVLPGLLILLQGLAQQERAWGVSFWCAGIRQYKWWLASAAVIAAITVTAQSGGSHAYFMGQASLSDRLVSQGWGQFFYLWRFLVPWNLSVDYPQPQISLGLALAAWLALAAILVAVIFYRKRLPQLFFGVAWWGICLLPVSGLVYVGASFTSDRYLYLAAAGPMLAILPSLKSLLQGRTRAPLMILCFVALAWGSLSFVQTGIWNNGWTLFGHATQAQPKSSMGWSNLGSLHHQAGNLTEAENCLTRAVALQAKDYIAWFNLGKVCSELGKHEEAYQAYRESLQWYPEYLPSIKNLGIFLMEKGKISEAGALFDRACQLTNDRDPVFLWLLCETELAQRDLSSAENTLKKLEFLPAVEQEILSGMQRARNFIEEARSSP